MTASNMLQHNVTLTPDFNIEETTDICGSITRTFYQVAARSREKAFRDALIALGWTPPRNDETAQGDEHGK